ncbi:MAG: hypothetical protein HRT61_22915, partial [Ekhidna sp.]|nr:hypothetical protein [Ekhidna sp.]
MGIKDLFITPIYIIIFILVAYFIRPYVTNKQTRKYFLPALWIRFAGAIALGLIYQFYYGGGDTFNYFIHGSRWIWQAFLDDPILGLELLLDNGGGRRPMETYHYSKYIWYYKDSKSFTIVRLSGLFGLFTLHTYSSIALFFATFSFSGLWALYSAVQKMYPSSRYLHLAVLFVPSVIFWGSGILKDTITLGALGWLTWAMIYLLIFDRKKVLAITIVFLTILMILKIKSYIVLCFVPMVFVYLYSRYLSKIKNILARILVAPLLIVVIGSLGVLALSYASTEEYNLNNVAERAAITAYDIRYGWGSRTGGDGGYDIGIPDGSIS